MDGSPGGGSSHVDTTFLLLLSPAAPGARWNPRVAPSVGPQIWLRTVLPAPCAPLSYRCLPLALEGGICVPLLFPADGVGAAPQLILICFFPALKELVVPGPGSARDSDQDAQVPPASAPCQCVWGGAGMSGTGREQGLETGTCMLPLLSPAVPGSSCSCSKQPLDGGGRNSSAIWALWPCLAPTFLWSEGQCAAIHFSKTGLYLCIGSD